MNIVVTIPKSRQAEIEEEESKLQARIAAGEEGLSYFWAMSRRPKELRVGDRMYFIWDGAMRAFHRVIGFNENLKCETTGRQYRGCCVMLDPRIHEIVPIPMKGFQGFRYHTAPVCDKEDKPLSEEERMQKVRDLMDQAQANCRSASAELEESDKDWANDMIGKLEEEADRIEVLMRDID